MPNGHQSTSFDEVRRHFVAADDFLLETMTEQGQLDLPTWAMKRHVQLARAALTNGLQLLEDLERVTCVMLRAKGRAS